MSASGPMSEEARDLMNATETDEARAIRHARRREVLREELAPIIGRIVETIHRCGIEALGLEPVIAERERRAAERGRRDSYDAGRTAGRREGRAELLLEWQEAAETIRSLADSFAEMGPTNGED